jgi:WD40 repeat protein
MQLRSPKVLIPILLLVALIVWVVLANISPISIRYVLHPNTGPVRRVAFSPDGQILATGGDNSTVALWQASDGSMLRTINAGGHMSSLAFSPDGKILAVANISSVQFWRPSGQKLSLSLNPPGQRILQVLYSPDGSIIATLSDADWIRLWSAEDGSLLRVLEAPAAGPTDFAFSPDGKSLAASFDGGVWLWNIENGSLFRTPVATDDEGTMFGGVAWAPDGKTVASVRGGAILLWSVSNGEVVRTIPAPAYTSLSGIAYSPSGSMIASGELTVPDPNILIWNAVDGKLRYKLGGHSSVITDLAFSPDGKLLASASVDETVRLWNIGDAAGK